MMDDTEPVFSFTPVPIDQAVSGAPSVDPVCGRIVYPGTGADTLTHAGITNEFCSLECTRAFAANPNRYRAA